MADMESGTHPIIIIKKKGGHAAHHGGAWKVAYADFVTAMMALFIVLWLLNTSQDTQKMVGGYFMDPLGAGKEMGTGMRGSGQTVNLKKDEMAKLKEKIELADTTLKKQRVEIESAKSTAYLTTEGTTVRAIVLWLHLIVFLAMLGRVWLARRGNKPLPRVDWNW